MNEEFLERIELIVSVGAKNILNTEEAAWYIGVTADRVRHLVMENAFPRFIAGRKAYYKKADIEAYLTAIRASSQEEIEMQANRYIMNKK